MHASEFDYFLPPELIAQHPVVPRDASRMMLLDRSEGRVEHLAFRDLPSLLQSGDLLVANDTRVIPARLIGHRSTGARVEVLLLHCLEKQTWRCMVNPGRKVKPGDNLTFSDELTGEVLERMEGGTRSIQFVCRDDFETVLERTGQTPLPPYISRPQPDPADREKYQTVFAQQPGAVAAPTAGLHFSDSVVGQIKEHGICLARITLHVGLGTFQPVKTGEIDQHKMDNEWYEISAETAELINETKSAGRQVIAVGTTVVRTLESAWDSRNRRVKAYSGWTDLFIRPGYDFRVVDALLTNFHLPRSTLLMLVSAFAGREFTLRAYEEAIREGYRFYSYGDCMLIM